MELQMKSNLLRVIIMDVSGVYAQMYDEIYCDQDRYNEILAEFVCSDKYKVIKI